MPIVLQAVVEGILNNFVELDCFISCKFYDSYL